MSRELQRSVGNRNTAAGIGIAASLVDEVAERDWQIHVDRRAGWHNW
jgi:hypothetical protein